MSSDVGYTDIDEPFRDAYRPTLDVAVGKAELIRKNAWLNRFQIAFIADPRTELGEARAAVARAA